MPKDTILLISSDAELRTWLGAHVLQPAGFACEGAPNLATARAKIAVYLPQLILIALSEQTADDLAFVAEQESLIPAVVILPERSLELIEAVLAHGACDVLTQPLNAVQALYNKE